MSQFTIEWLDFGRKPQCRPDPNYPAGKDIDAAGPTVKSCTVDLPYPAKRCGLYKLTCRRCGLKVAGTTAGRPDDPKSVRLACKELLQ